MEVSWCRSPIERNGAEKNVSPQKVDNIFVRADFLIIVRMNMITKNGGGVRDNFTTQSELIVVPEFPGEKVGAASRLLPCQKHDSVALYSGDGGTMK